MNQNININHNVIVYTMLDMLELRDGYTGTHAKHVEDYMSLLIAQMLKKNKWDLSLKDGFIFSQASLLHDIGKIAIPDRILQNTGKLSDEDYDVIKTHTTLGASSLEKTMAFIEDEFMPIVFNITKYHHERWDGSGYPDGLKGEEIPLEARIAAIADVYDALRTERTYKPALDRKTSYNIILNGTGTSFDPDLIDVFIQVEEDFNKYASSSN